MSSYRDDLVAKEARITALEGEVATLDRELLERSRNQGTPPAPRLIAHGLAGFTAGLALGWTVAQSEDLVASGSDTEEPPAPADDSSEIPRMLHSRRSIPEHLEVTVLRFDDCLGFPCCTDKTHSRTDIVRMPTMGDCGRAVLETALARFGIRTQQPLGIAVYGEDALNLDAPVRQGAAILDGPRVALELDQPVSLIGMSFTNPIAPRQDTGWVNKLRRDIRMVAKDERGRALAEVQAVMVGPSGSAEEAAEEAEFLGIYTDEGQFIKTLEIELTGPTPVAVDNLVMHPPIAPNLATTH